MKKRLLVVAASLSLIAACSAAPTGNDKDALPQGTVSSSAENPAPAEPAPKASTCDNAREAILTGTKADIEKALKALVKDKTADANARESAQDYLTETDATLRGMYLDLIQMACTL